MPNGKTQNYGLSQWVKSDKVLMEDFNKDNKTIDEALEALDVRVDGKADQSALNAATSAQAADKSALTSMITLRNCRVEWSSYTGNAAYNAFSNRRITFSKRPAVFFVFGNGGLLVGAGDSTVNVLHYDLGTMTSVYPHQWDGNTLVLHSGNGTVGMNLKDQKYYALGLIAES